MARPKAAAPKRKGPRPKGNKRAMRIKKKTARGKKVPLLSPEYTNIKRLEAIHRLLSRRVCHFGEIMMECDEDEMSLAGLLRFMRAARLVSRKTRFLKTFQAQDWRRSVWQEFYYAKGSSEDFSNFCLGYFMLDPGAASTSSYGSLGYRRRQYYDASTRRKYRRGKRADGTRARSVRHKNVQLTRTLQRFEKHHIEIVERAEASWVAWVACNVPDDAAWSSRSVGTVLRSIHKHGDLETTLSSLITGDRREFRAWLRNTSELTFMWIWARGRALYFKGGVVFEDLPRLEIMRAPEDFKSRVLDVKADRAVGTGLKASNAAVFEDTMERDRRRALALLVPFEARVKGGELPAEVLESGPASLSSKASGLTPHTMRVLDRRRRGTLSEQETARQRAGELLKAVGKPRRLEED